MNEIIQPVVSVLTTCYNREKYIAEAMNSVLASDFKNFELIVVDDCSDDGSFSIAEDIAKKDERIKVFRNEKNLGDYPNRNIAASYAKGKYIKYLDSDDIMYPHCLGVMVSAMEQFPGAGYGLSAQGYEESQMPIVKNCREAYLEHFGSKKHFDRAPGSAIILKEAFNKTGGFSGKRMIGDYELWFKLSCYYPLVVFQRDLVWDRAHAGQERQSDYAKSYDKMRKEVLQSAFQNEHCPLSETDKKNIINRLKKKAIKNRIKKIISG